MGKVEDERQARLAQALRENLRRRKAQSRGDDGLDVQPESVPSPPPVDSDGD